MNSLSELENHRNILATSGKFLQLKRTYNKKNRVIQNTNTDKVWSSKVMKKMPRKYYMYWDKISKVVNYLEDKKGNLLDIGFGHGDIENKLKRNSGLHFYGIDISTEAVRKAKQNLIGEYKKGSIGKVKLRNNFFDYVIALDVLEHISVDQTLKVLKEMNRLLKRNGELILSVPLNEDLEKMISTRRNKNHHVRIYTENILFAELKLTGFRVLKSQHLYAFDKLYKIKSLLVPLFSPLKKPNLLIVVATKT